MALKLRVVPFGRDAARALRDELAEFQRDDPLRPVTVVVPRHTVGLATRRLLASGDLGPAPGHGRAGVLNVRFTTLPRLADQLAGTRLAAAGRLPASAAAVHAAVRAVLQTAPGPVFGPVKGHPATVRALSDAYRDLKGLSPQAAGNVARQSERAAEVVRVVGEVRVRLADWYDDGDLLTTALDVIRGDAVAVAGLIGPLVVYLPLRMSTLDEQLVRAMAGAGPVTMLIGVTGDDGADQTGRSIVERFVDVTGPPTFDTAVVHGTAVASCPSADTEVLRAIRAVMENLNDGIALERMAIVHPGTGPYARQIHESLTRAGIPFNGTGVRALSSTIAGRALLGIFELADHDWRRDDLTAWLSAVPLLHDGREVPSTAWDLISRDAGITSGLSGWADHLASYAAARRAEIDLLDAPGADDVSAARRQRHIGAIERSEALGAFVAGLSARFERLPDSWGGWSRWSLALLRDYLGGPVRRGRWPTDESEAFTTVEAALQRLTVLDGIDPGPDLSSFRSVLNAELDAPAPQTTRFGRGVLVGQLGDLVGLDLDVLFVLGMTDGTFPGRSTDDPLLPESERLASGADMPLAGIAPGEAYRDYLAALAAADRRILSFARGDQRQGREQRPSRWLLDTLQALGATVSDAPDVPGAVPGAPAGGRRLFSSDLDRLGPLPVLSVVASYTAAVRAPGEPASISDRDIRSLLVWRDAHGTIDAHFLARTDPVLHLGLTARRQRRSSRFTRFDGRIDRQGIPSPAEGTAQSPTGLESYAECPRRYLLDKLLRITVRDRPEDVWQIEASDRGTLIHEILERFIGEEVRLARRDRIRPESAWPDDKARRIRQIAADVFREYEHRGVTGRPLLWGLEQAAILRDLARFLKEDDAYRSASGMVPEAVEMTFGPGVGPEVIVDVPGGRTVAFKGKGDRVDRGDDGAAVITDYKTGSTWDYGNVDSDPVDRGRKLQLPVYGLAARSRFGDVAVRARYWFVSQKANFGVVGYDLTDERLERFRQVVGTIVDGIETGLFPANPGAERNGDFEHCHYCDFKPICPVDRDRDWERVRTDAVLQEYVSLAEGPGGTP